MTRLAEHMGIHRQHVWTWIREDITPVMIITGMVRPVIPSGWGRAVTATTIATPIIPGHPGPPARNSKAAEVIIRDPGPTCAKATGAVEDIMRPGTAAKNTRAVAGSLFPVTANPGVRAAVSSAESTAIAAMANALPVDSRAVAAPTNPVLSRRSQGLPPFQSRPQG